MTLPRTRRTIAFAVAVGVALPLLSVSALAWSFSDRTDHLDAIPVAIVNDDTIVTDPSPMAAGRALTAGLTEPSSGEEVLDWHLTTADAATAGLKDGTYYSVLTIPSDFSKDVLSSGTDSPVKAKLSLTSNATASASAGIISQEVATAATSALATQVTSAYLDNVYVGFSSISDSMSSAADGAKSLASGASSLADGVTKLSSGARSLATGVDSLSSGASSLSTGTASLASGASSVNSAATSLAAGTKKLASGAASLSTSAATLSSGATTTSGGADQLATTLAALSASCASASPSKTFCSNLAAAAKASDGLSTGTATLATGASALATGASTLASSTTSLDAGAQKLADGTGTLASGAKKTDAGADSLASGAASAATASHSLASGAGSLVSGADSLDSGAKQLESGLEKAVAAVPDYTDDQQKTLSSVVSEPVTLSSNSTGTNGWAAAAIAATVLWLGALATLVLTARGLRAGAAAAPVSTRRLVALTVLPALAVALAQALITFVTLVAFQLSFDSAAGFALLSGLAAICFTLVATALRSVAPRIGIAVFVVLFVLQLAAVGNIVPLQTAPAVLQWLNGWLPLTAFINGASQLAGGGALFSIAAVCTTLVLWSLAGLAVTVIGHRRRRSFDPAPTRLAASV